MFLIFMSTCLCTSPFFVKKRSTESALLKKTFIMLTNIEKLPIKSELGTRYIFFDTLLVSNKRCLTKRITSYLGVLRQFSSIKRIINFVHSISPLPSLGDQPPPLLLAGNLPLSFRSTSANPVSNSIPPGGQPTSFLVVNVQSSWRSISVHCTYVLFQVDLVSFLSHEKFTPISLN